MQRLTATEKWTYAIGNMPFSVKDAAYVNFVVFYYTQVQGLSGTLAGLGQGGVVVTTHLDRGRSGLLSCFQVCDLLGATLLTDPHQRREQPVAHQDPQREERDRAPEDLPDLVGDHRVDGGRILLGQTDEDCGEHQTNLRRMKTTKPMRASASVKAMPRNIVVWT